MDAVLYAIFLTKREGRSAPSKDAILRHVDHLRNLDKEGKLVLCGPFSDHPSALVVVRAKDKAEAQVIAERDPFVGDGLRDYELRTWQIAHAQNNYLA